MPVFTRSNVTRKVTTIDDDAGFQLGKHGREGNLNFHFYGFEVKKMIVPKS